MPKPMRKKNGNISKSWFTFTEFFFLIFVFFFFFFGSDRVSGLPPPATNPLRKSVAEKKKSHFFGTRLAKKQKKNMSKRNVLFFFLLVGDKNKFANRQIRTHAQQDNLSAEFLFSFIFRISGANPIISQRHCVLFIFFLKVWQLCTGFGRL